MSSTAIADVSLSGPIQTEDGRNQVSYYTQLFTKSVREWRSVARQSIWCWISIRTRVSWAPSSTGTRCSTNQNAQEYSLFLFAKMTADFRLNSRDLVEDTLRQHEMLCSKCSRFLESILFRAVSMHTKKAKISYNICPMTTDRWEEVSWRTMQA